QAAIATGFAKSTADRPAYFGDYGSPLRDNALMIALLHERGLAKPEYDARVVNLGREMDARRNSGWLWLSTQEQVALARLGKALMANQKKLVSGELAVGEKTESIEARKVFARVFDMAQLAQGVRFSPQGE